MSYWELAAGTYVVGGQAFEDTQFQQGVMTHFLLSGLAGEADQNHDGFITTEEITSYLSLKVSAYSAKIPVAARLQYENNQVGEVLVSSEPI